MPVWVGFLNTVVLTDASGCGITRVYRNGIDPSGFGTILVLWEGRTIVLLETSKKQYSSELMTHPSTGTLASSSCHTSGMRCWLDHQKYI